MAAKVKIDIIGRATDAIRALRDASDATEKLRRKVTTANAEMRGLTSTTSVFALVSKVAAIRGVGMAAAIAAAIPAAVQLGAALQPLLGLIVGLPAVLLAGGLAFGAFKIATFGVQDAVTAALTGTVEQFTKALEAIPPSAQRFALAVRTLRDPIRSLRADVSAAFFTPLIAQVAPFAGIIRRNLVPALVTVAGALGTVLAGLGKTLTSAPLLAALKSTAAATARAFLLLGPSLGRLLTVLATVTTAGAPLIERMAKGLAGLVDLFSAWITKSSRSGDLNRWLDEGVATFKQLWAIGSDVLGTLVNIFAAGKTPGGGLLADIEKITKSWLTWTSANPGRIKQFIKDFNGFLKATVNLVKAALPAVQAVSKELLPLVKKIIEFVAAHPQLAALAIVLSKLGALKIGASVVSGLLGMCTNALCAASNVAKLGGASTGAVGPLARLATGLRNVGAGLSLLGQGAAVGEVAGLGAAGAIASGIAVAGALALGAGIAYFGGKLVTKILDDNNVDMYRWVNETLPNIGRDAERWGTSLKPKLAKAVHGIGVVLAIPAKQIHDKLNEIWRGLSHFPARIAGAFSTVGADFSRAAGDAVSGFMSGINMRYKAAKSTVAAFGANILTWFRQAIGSHSPSRLFALQGVSIVDGLTVGIRSQQAQLHATMDGLSTGMQAAVAYTPAAPQVHVHMQPGQTTTELQNHLVKSLDAYARRTGYRTARTA